MNPSTLAAAFMAVLAADPPGEPLDISRWRIIGSESGPVNYYQVMSTPEGRFLRATYQPPWKTSVVGIQVKQDTHAHKLRWRWRAQVLPQGGNECVPGKADSTAMLYAAWRAGLKWHVLKFVWSSLAPKGTRCAYKDNWFRSEAVVVLESGAEHLHQWVTEEVDLDAEYRRSFAKGDPKASVPSFKGLALLTDGDQTNSVSSADYADFQLVP